MNKQEKIKDLLKNILERKEELITKDFDSNSLILITNNFTIRVLTSALDFDNNNWLQEVKTLFGMPFVVLEDSKFGSISEYGQPYFEIHPIIKE